MTEVYYHVRDEPMDVGTVILPTWGPVIMLYGKQHNCYNREMFLESCRYQAFRSKPSRLHTTYAFLNIETAEAFRSVFNKTGNIYSVVAMVPDLPYHIGDMNLVDPTEAVPDRNEAAYLYWSGELMIRYSGFPDIVWAERITVSPLEVVGIAKSF